MGRLDPQGGTTAAGIAAMAVVAAFTLSALTKAADLAEFQQTIRALLPHAKHRQVLRVALATIAGELALAAWVASGTRPRLAAVAVIVVLAGLSVLAFAVRDRQLRCNCFGSLTTARLGWPTVGRNALLAATTVVWLTASAAPPRPGFPVFAIAVLAAIGLLLARQLRQMAPRFLAPPPPPGTPGIEWLDTGNRP